MKNSMKKIIVILNILLLVCNTFSQKIDNPALDSAISKADKLISTDPRAFFKNVESLIVYKQGEIKFEKYYNGFNKDSLHQTQSQTKSVVSLLMGIAIDKGYIRSENNPVSAYFPEYFGKQDNLKSKVTIRDLLTMSAGFEWEEMLPMNDPKNDNMNMFRSYKWLNYALTRSVVKEPFAVINADDYYGKDGFKQIYNFLTTEVSPTNYGMVGYSLNKTLSENGFVSRGVCQTKDGLLQEIKERTKIQREEDGIYYSDGDEKYLLPEDSVVSMNFWGFDHTIFPHLKSSFDRFLNEKHNDPKAEFFIPIIVDELISSGQIELKGHGLQRAVDGRLRPHLVFDRGDAVRLEGPGAQRVALDGHRRRPGLVQQPGPRTRAWRAAGPRPGGFGVAGARGRSLSAGLKPGAGGSPAPHAAGLPRGFRPAVRPAPRANGPTGRAGRARSRARCAVLRFPPSWRRWRPSPW